MNNVIRFIIAVAVPQAVGIVAGLATAAGTGDWYRELDKPALTPPSWIFGPVWTVLYLMMGIASYLVWRKGLDEPGVRVALVVFWIHLAFNFLWSILFFGLRSPTAALVDIAVLAALIVFSAALFFRVSRPAGMLLVPYLLWTCFAAYLNYSFWVLNR